MKEIIMMNKAQIIESFQSMSVDDLFEINKVLVGICKAKQRGDRNINGVIAKAAFSVHDNVEWTSVKNHGLVMNGTIIKINPKNIRVNVTQGAFKGNWNVSPGMLRKVS